MPRILVKSNGRTIRKKRPTTWESLLIIMAAIHRQKPQILGFAQSHSCECLCLTTITRPWLPEAIRVIDAIISTPFIFLDHRKIGMITSTAWIALRTYRFRYGPFVIKMKRRMSEQRTPHQGQPIKRRCWKLMRENNRTNSTRPVFMAILIQPTHPTDRM